MKTIGVFLLTIVAFAAESGPLTDQRIFELAGLGVSGEEMIRIIAAAPSVNFDLRPGSMENLTKAGVSDDVIRAMAAKQNGEMVPDLAPAGRPISLALTRTRPTPTAQAVAPLPGRKLVREADPNRTRVFVGETAAWEASSFNITHVSNSFAGSFGRYHSGLIRLTISVMKQLNDHCPTVTVVNSPESADLFLRLDRNTTMWARHDDMAVFNRAGEMVFVSSTHSLSKDVKRFCESPVFSPVSTTATMASVGK